MGPISEGYVQLALDSVRCMHHLFFFFFGNLLLCALGYRTPCSTSVMGYMTGVHIYLMSY
jgi:hypothetical protein